VRADDLSGCIPLQPFGARIPGRDPALNIEHEDRAVSNGVHQQIEQLPVSAHVRLRVGPHDAPALQDRKQLSPH
jgi:hypothetical protein